MAHLGHISRLWGLAGVEVFLMSGVIRVMPSWSEISLSPHRLLAGVALALLLPLMMYFEGYRGFYKGFAPRVVSRSKALSVEPQILHSLLAPLFCMGFVGSTTRRKVSLWIITITIVGLVIWIKALPQPWRWVIDVSVGVALFGGVLSIIWLAYSDWDSEGYLCDPELPQ